MITAKHKNVTIDHERAKAMRKQPTIPEDRLWRALRKISGKTGAKFRHQHPIHPYIVDFACLPARLIIEIDGFSHDTRLVYDQKRTLYLENLGYKILRFSNGDVASNLEGVVTTIEITAKELLKADK